MKDAETKEEPRCGLCRHWHASPADPMNLAAPRTGLCRAIPPQPIVFVAGQSVQGMNVHVEYRYPTVYANFAGCGMYEERLQLTIKN
jgi:hypothetical protein